MIYSPAGSLVEQEEPDGEEAAAGHRLSGPPHLRPHSSHCPHCEELQLRPCK